MVGVLAALCAAGSCLGVPSEVRPPAPSRLVLADSLRGRGRVAEALPHYRALRDSLAAAADTENLWRAHIAYANSLTRLSRFDSSAAALAEARPLVGSDPRREAAWRVERALLHSRRGRLDSALVEGQLAQRIARDLEDPEREMGAIHVVGEASSLSGRYPEAIAANERLLQLARQAADTQRMALALNQVAIDYRHVGRFPDATLAYEEALGLYRLAANPAGVAMVLYNLSNVAWSTGDLERAVALREESLKELEQTSDRRGRALVLRALGEAHVRAGNHGEARRHLEASHAISRELRQPYQIALGAVQLSELAVAEGRLADAEAWARSAIAIADSLGYARQRVSARSVLTRALALQRDASARRLAEEAVSIADSLGDPEAQFEAFQARAAALEALGGDAAAAHLRAIDLLESWRGRLALGDLRFGVTEPRSSAYEGAVRTLIATGRIDEAFVAAERARARLLLEVMTDRANVAVADTGAAGLRQRLREREEARRSVTQRAIQAALARDVSSLVASLDSIESAERKRPGAARLGRPTLTTMSQLRSVLLSTERGLLTFHWGDSAVYGWWITREAIRGRRLGASDSLAKIVDFLRGAIERPGGPDWRAAARRAYDAFVQPLAPSPTSEVLVVADGPLAHVPIEVLTPSDSAGPWGVTRVVTYLPSASVGVHLARMRRATSWTDAVLAIGDPAARPRIRQARERASTDSLLPPLPHAAEEARAIRDLFRPLGAEALIGRAATLERWLRRDPARYRFLHFAAHARVSDRRPQDTHVVLAGSRLDLAAIRRLQLRAEVVTLSACETALGQRVRGEGVIGLPHAFLAAGARATVVSLWRVEDRSTAAFMEQFYRALRDGLNPGQALMTVRRAHLARGGGSDHPSRWAAFVLVGEPGTSAAPDSGHVER